MARPRKNSAVPPTRDRVCDAARGVFARAGHANATLGEIAKAVGITRPSLLHHFPSKDALYREVVAAAFAELGGTLAGPLSAGGSYPERVEALAAAFGGFVREHPEVARIVLRELMAEGGPGQEILLEQVAPLLDRVEAFVEAEGQAYLAPGVGARGALLTVVSEALVRSAAGPLRAPLWGAAHTADLTRGLSRALLWRTP